jgi:hypothetical protein
MEDQRNTVNRPGTIRLRPQIPVAEFQLRGAIGFRNIQKTFRLRPVAKCAADVVISMGEQALDNMQPEESTRPRDQDLQLRASG